MSVEDSIIYDFAYGLIGRIGHIFDVLIADVLFGLFAFLAGLIEKFAFEVGKRTLPAETNGEGGILGGFGDATQGLGDWLGNIFVADWFLHTITVLILAIICLVVALINVINFIWIERKFLGRLMDRRGPMHVGYLGWIQQFADVIKLFVKEIIVPAKADRLLYRVGPIVFIASSIMIVAAIPLAQGLVMADVPMALPLMLALFAVAPVAVLVTGWAPNNKFTLIGGIRSTAQMMSYEIPLMLSIMPVILLAGSFNSYDIVGLWTNDAGLWGGPAWMWPILLFFVLLIPFVVFFVSMVAEVERIPFDLPEAESELVEGWTTEYGGLRFGFFMMASYIRGYAASAIGAIIFLGGWAGPHLFSFGSSELNALIWGFLWLMLKTYIIWFFFVWIRGSLPRIRTDQILEVGWKGLLPWSIVGMVIGVAFFELLHMEFWTWAIFGGVFG